MEKEKEKKEVKTKTTKKEPTTKEEKKEVKKPVQAKFCGECGNKLGKNDKFCENCGAPTHIEIKEEKKSPKAVEKEEKKEEVEDKKEKEVTKVVEKEEKVVEPIPKKKSNKGLIITIIVLGSLLGIGVIVLLLCLILGVFSPKPKTNWGELYAAKIQEAVDYHKKYPKAEMYGVVQGINKYNIKIVDIGEKYPVMISEAKKDDKTSRMIYYIDNDKVGYVSSEANDDIKLFYNTEVKDYIWYRETKSGITSYYDPIGKIVDQEKSSSISNNKCYNCTTQANNENIKADKYTSYTFYEKENLSDTDIEKYISYKDQVLIEVEKKVPTKTIDIDKPKVNEVIANLEESYKEKEELITNKDAKNVEKVTKEIDEKVEEYNKKQEELALNSSNFQSKVGEHLKWFSAAYSGSYYGFNHVYKYIDVTGKVKVPGTPSDYMVYEVSGAKSKEDMKNTVLKYVEQSVFDNLNRRHYKTMFNDLYDYNGKVYLVEGGIGDGPYIKPEEARFVSYANGEAKVQLFQKDPFEGSTTATITVTIRYINGEYKITSYN